MIERKLRKATHEIEEKQFYVKIYLIFQRIYINDWVKYCLAIHLPRTVTQQDDISVKKMQFK